MNEKVSRLVYRAATAIASVSLVAGLTSCGAPVADVKGNHASTETDKSADTLGEARSEAIESVMNFLESRKSAGRVSTSGVVDIESVQNTLAHPDAPNASELAKQLVEGDGYYYFYQGGSGGGNLVTIEMMIKETDQGGVKIAYVQNAFNGEYGVKDGVMVRENDVLVVAPVGGEGQIETPVMVIQILKDRTRMDLVDPGSGEAVRLETKADPEVGGLFDQVNDTFALMQGVAAAGLEPTATPETRGGVVTATPGQTETPEAELTVEPTATPEAELTVEPTVTPEAELTVEPTVTPEAELTVEPTATLVPQTVMEAPEKVAVPISSEGEAESNFGVELEHQNQRYNECGPTAILMALRALGVKTTIDEVVDVAKSIPPNEGGLDTTVTKNPVVFSAGAAVRVVERFGGKVEGGDGMSVEWIKDRLAEGKPVIVLISDDSLKYFAHFIGVENVTGTIVEVDDPLLRADLVMDREEFTRRWNVPNLDKGDPLQKEGHQNFAIALSLN